ncbi:MAG: amidohydrolase family protein [Reichenbachiella sp.]|uniref:metal-dependent hydrolase family protein n=1 Tax=Reichenbachiella sp. TaxID=2184521 RepID=UPI0029672805|nr:amidohydrolase family protein [Reichenbachiella sp.]MDW3208908.1 amidohydrolase family protein [Reichenbachiella sp.]
MKKCLLILAVFAFTHLQAQKTYIHCGALIDGYSDKPTKERTIVIDAGRIVEVKNGFASPAKEDALIDLREYTVLPGFIDMHVHLEHETGKNKYMNKFTQNPEDKAFESVVYAERTLLAGFTTVRDLGGSGVNISLRNAINKGLIDGPRIYTAGKALGVTGGHADPTNGYSQKLMGNPGPREGVVNGVEDAKQAVRQRYKNGADLIKITATGGVLSLAKNGTGPHFQEDEIRAIVETARDYGFHVAAHAHGDEGMQRAVRAGVTTIEHGTYMSEETMQMMKDRNTYFIPTLLAGDFVAEKAAEEGYYPEIIVPKAAAVGPQIFDTYKKAVKYGVPIGFGTDAGVFLHGDNGKEFELMVAGGMSAMQAIKCATSINASILQESENLGGIKKGVYADLVAVKGDPIKDIKLLQQIPFVMKGGVVYKSVN